MTDLSTHMEHGQANLLADLGQMPAQDVTQKGRRLGIEGPFLPRLAERVIELMGEPWPELVEQRDTIMKWTAAEEESFSRTLAQGERPLHAAAGETQHVSFPFARQAIFAGQLVRHLLRGGARVGLAQAVRLGDADVRHSISLLIQIKQARHDAS